MKIGIANDHQGYLLKKKITRYLSTKNIEVIDYGTNSNKAVDYPEFAFLVGNAINRKEIDLGILICATGIGMSIAANKMAGIRCAKVCNTKDTKHSRMDNDANVIALSSNTPMIRVKDIIDCFLKIPFSGEERHIRRNKEVDQMAQL